MSDKRIIDNFKVNDEVFIPKRPADVNEYPVWVSGMNSLEGRYFRITRINKLIDHGMDSFEINNNGDEWDINPAWVIKICRGRNSK